MVGYVGPCDNMDTIFLYMNDGKIMEKTLEKKWDSWNIINGSFRKYR